jgi:hypothetical protein
MKDDLLKTAENILEECFTQIEFLIKNGKKLKNLTNGMVDTRKICDFRTGIYLVYLSDLNIGILKHVSISQIETFLDKGFFNENICDQKTYILNLKYSLVD